MNIIEAIAKRKDVEPSEGKSKYGDVSFADEKNKKYPIDTEDHIRAAWNYINKSDNAAKYSAADVKAIKAKIIAAWKRKIDKDGPPSAQEDKAESSYLIVTAETTMDFNGEAPSQITYMPKGEWNIKPRVNGVPKEITVMVDQNAAAVLQASFDKRASAPPRPFGGFDHKLGRASFHPKGFLWDDEKGVILNVDWTKAGREAIEGKDYGYFSPTFVLSTNRVVGLTTKGEIGSLTNSPAFEQIGLIAASFDPDDIIDPDDNAKIGVTMKITNKLVELALITAEQGEDEDAICAAIEHLHSDLATVRAENATLVKENEKYRTEAQKVAGKAADAVIEAAIAEGKIPAQNAKLIAYHRSQLIANPELAKEVIEAMNPNPALRKVIDVKAGDSRGNLMAEGKTKAKLVADQHNVVREIMAANASLSYADAFNKARREHAELFIEAV